MATVSTSKVSKVLRGSKAALVFAVIAALMVLVSAAIGPFIKENPAVMLFVRVGFVGTLIWQLDRVIARMASIERSSLPGTVVNRLRLYLGGVFLLVEGMVGVSLW